MKKFARIALSGLVLLGFAGAGRAAVTPEDVWANWQANSAASGQTVVAESVERDGDTLVMMGVVLTSTTPDSTTEVRLGELRMTDLGDGTVAIAWPASFPMTVTETNPPSQIVVDISHDNMTQTASGDPDAVQYDLVAPSVKIKLTRVDDVAATAQNLTLEATLADVTAQSLITQGADMTSDLTVGGLALAVVGMEAGDEFRLTAAIQDIAASTVGAFGTTLHEPDFIKSLALGAVAHAQFTTGASDFALEITSATGPSVIKGTSASSTVQIAIDASGLDYQAQQMGVALIVNAPEIPVADAAFGFQELGFGLKMPLVDSPDAQAFALQTRLINLTVSDAVWGLLDPAAALPHDPLNLVIDAEGTAKVMAATPNAAGMPAEVQDLNLKELKLSVAGAELTGSGGGTVDYATGKPSPVMDLNFKLLGANGLMDRLVAAGFLQAEQLMMPRMMLAMVAQPDPAGGDSLLSKIELRDGGVFANGQKLYDLP